MTVSDNENNIKRKNGRGSDGEREIEREKKDEEGVRGDDENIYKKKNHHCGNRVVLSSQALRLSLAHLNKATADCQGKQEQRTEGRGQSP